MAVAIALLGMVMAGSAAPASAAAQSAATRPAATLPLTASSTTPSGSTVLIAMGHLDDPANTFWEVFTRSTGSASWALHTPPGVASNGGLVLSAPVGGLLMIGFLTSADLKFSPVALSTDGGRRWSPGELPDSLTRSPDAVALGPTGHALALVSGDVQRVLMSNGDLSTWHSLVSARALSRVVSACGVQSLTAVSLGPASQSMVGAACSRPGQIGIYAPLPAPGTGRANWRDIGPTLSTRAGTATVLRLARTSGSVEGLAQARSDATSSLVAFWGQGTSERWSTSAPTVVPARWAVTATAAGGGSGQGMAVLLGDGPQRRVVDISGPGAPWATLPDPPPGTSGIAGVGYGVDAFVVHASHLAVWAWTPGAGAWQPVESITVPVPYGSSS
jgi:hypothetical protein